MIKNDFFQSIYKCSGSLITVNHKFNLDLFSAKSVKFNGSEYKIGDFLIENETIAAKIEKLYVSQVKDMVVLCFSLYTISYDQNLLAYKVSDYRGTELDLIVNFKNGPSSCHNVGGNIFIKKRI